jgi:hypothetical protein
MKRKTWLLVKMNHRASDGLFEQFGPEDGVGGSRFYFQLIIAGREILEIVEGDAVGPGFKASAQHADDLPLLDVGEEDDAVDGFFAGYLEHEIMIERIRVHRDFNCHNHSLWDFGVLGDRLGRVLVALVGAFSGGRYVEPL